MNMVHTEAYKLLNTHANHTSTLSPNNTSQLVAAAALSASRVRQLILTRRQAPRPHGRAMQQPTLHRSLELLPRLHCAAGGAAGPAHKTRKFASPDRQGSVEARKHGIVNPLVSSPQQAPALASSGAGPANAAGGRRPTLTPNLSPSASSGAARRRPCSRHNSSPTASAAAAGRRPCSRHSAVLLLWQLLRGCAQLLLRGS